MPPTAAQLSRCLLLLSICYLAACTTNPASEEQLPVLLPNANDYFQDQLADGTLGPKMVRLPATRFKMGCQVKGDCYDDDKPVRIVEIPNGIAIMTHEVTFDEYDAFAKAAGYELPDDNGWGRGSRPVINVAWEDAVFYAHWLSEQTGQNYQLPSEAVWEYSARAGTSTSYFFGEDVTQLCQYANVADISEAAERNGKPLVNCDDGYGKQTAPVGSYQPNAFGLYDMSGNVREWMQDCYHDSYRRAPTDGSARLDDCDSEEKVLRGGAWFSFPWINSTSTRQNTEPFTMSFSIGFRLMRVE